MKGIAAPDPSPASPAPPGSPPYAATAQPPAGETLNDSIRAMRRPRWAWLPDALTVAAIIAVVALALLVAACG